MIGEMIERWKSETPIFFKKVRNLALWIGGSATTIYTSLATLEATNVFVPPILYTNILAHIVTASVVIAPLCQLTKVDLNKEPEK